MSAQSSNPVSTLVPFRKAHQWPTARAKAQQRKRNRRRIAREAQAQRDAEALRASTY